MADDNRLFSKKLDLTSSAGLLEGLSTIAEALRKKQIDTSQARTFIELIKQASGMIELTEKLSVDERPQGRKDVERLPGSTTAASVGSDGPMSVYSGKRRPDNVFSDVGVRR